MSSPIERISYRADEIAEDWLRRELAATNVQPLVIRQYAPKHSGLLHRLIELSPDHPRTVLVSGDGILETSGRIVRITSNLMRLDLERLMLLPWESIGAMFLRSYMTGKKWQGDWITDLPPGGDLPREPRPNPKAYNMQEVIARGEGQRLEFKSTFQYCLEKNQIDTSRRNDVCKTVAAFMNSEGGTLLIGVDDSGSIIGIERDLKVEVRSWDQLQKRIVETISHAVGNDNVRRCKITKVPFKDKSVVRIVVDRSHQPVFAKIDGKGKEEFYVRVGNTSPKFEGKEMVGYIKRHFPSNAPA